MAACYVLPCLLTFQCVCRSSAGGPGGANGSRGDDTYRGLSDTCKHCARDAYRRGTSIAGACSGCVCEDATIMCGCNGCPAVTPTSTFFSLDYSGYHRDAGHDVVTVHECTTADCAVRHHLATLAGDQTNNLKQGNAYRSSSGFLEVIFTSDVPLELVRTNDCNGLNSMWLASTAAEYAYNPADCVTMIRANPLCNQNFFKWVHLDFGDGNCGCFTDNSASLESCSSGNNGVWVYKILWNDMSTVSSGFSAEWSVDPCSECALGTFNDIITSDPICTSCGGGYYSHFLGATVCLACPSGTFSSAGVSLFETVFERASWSSSDTRCV